MTNAHHPQEIAATLAAAKNYPHREILVRLPAAYIYENQGADGGLCEALIRSGPCCSRGHLCSLGRRSNLGISSETLAEKIAALGTDTHYFPSFDAIETFLLENCVNGDLLIKYGGRRYCKSGTIKLLGQ